MKLFTLALFAIAGTNSLLIRDDMDVPELEPETKLSEAKPTKKAPKAKSGKKEEKKYKWTPPPGAFVI